MAVAGESLMNDTRRFTGRAAIDTGKGCVGVRCYQKGFVPMLYLSNTGID